MSTSCIELISRNTDNIESWGSTGISRENIKNVHTSDVNFDGNW